MWRLRGLLARFSQGCSSDAGAYRSGGGISNGIRVAALSGVSSFVAWLRRASCGGCRSAPPPVGPRDWRVGSRRPCGRRNRGGLRFSGAAGFAWLRILSAMRSICSSSAARPREAPLRGAFCRWRWLSGTLRPALGTAAARLCALAPFLLTHSQFNGVLQKLSLFPFKSHRSGR
jgi:hypothetical protein